MDEQLRSREREVEDAPPEVALRFARDLLRAGQRDDAWARYAPLQLHDPDLDALGRELAAEEAARVAALPPGATARRLREHGPCDWLELDVDRAADADATCLRHVRWLDLTRATGAPADLAALERFPRVDLLSLDGRLGARDPWEGMLEEDDGRPRLRPELLEALATHAPLRGLTLRCFSVAGSLAPLTPLAPRLRRLTLCDLHGLDPREWGWVDALRRLEVFVALEVSVPPSALRALPASLRYLNLFRQTLSATALSDVLRGRRLEGLCLGELEGLSGPGWLAALPATLAHLDLNGVGEVPAPTLLEHALRLPQLEHLGLSLGGDADLARLAELQHLTRLALSGRVSEAALLSAAPTLGRLRELDISDACWLGQAGLELLLRTFRGRRLHARLRGVPSSQIARLTQLGLEALYLTVAPLGQDAGERLQATLRAATPDALVFAHSAGPGQLASLEPDALALLQHALELPELSLTTPWASVAGAELAREQLEAAYAYPNGPPLSLGACVADTLASLRAHLEERFA